MLTTNGFTHWNLSTEPFVLSCVEGRTAGFT